MLRVSFLDALQAPAAPNIFPNVPKHRENDVRETDANQNADNG